jgi:hypothetical protein
MSRSQCRNFLETQQEVVKGNNRVKFLPNRFAAASKSSIPTQPCSSREMPIASGWCRSTKLRNLLVEISSRSIWLPLFTRTTVGLSEVQTFYSEVPGPGIPRHAAAERGRTAKSPSVIDQLS